jgi:hypothetical protein
MWPERETASYLIIIAISKLLGQCIKMSNYRELIGNFFPKPLVIEGLTGECVWALPRLPVTSKNTLSFQMCMTILSATGG